MTAPVYRKPTDLPDIIPVFPLPGVLLFARANLPLNIFEPRYLNMIDDAMRGDRLIGMIQPQPGAGSETTPALSRVGGVGRIISYSETDDGRYLISLRGLCRFDMVEECEPDRPYRRSKVSYDRFAHDLAAPDIEDEDHIRTELLMALRTFLNRNGLKADWSTVTDAPLETLLYTLSSGCPFSPSEKQLLLETPTLTQQCQTLITLLQVSEADAGGTMQ